MAQTTLLEMGSSDPIWRAWELERLAAARLTVPLESTHLRSLQDDSFLDVYGMPGLTATAKQGRASNPQGPASWYLCEQIAALVGTPDQELAPASCLYTVAFCVPEHRQDEFNRWYEEEHAPLLLQSPEWLSCRRYQVLEGGPVATTHIACYFLKGPHALDAPQREEARNTPWRRRLLQEDWFKGRFNLYRAI